MKSLQEEIARLDAEIKRLQERRDAFVDALAMVSGTAPSTPPAAPQARKRSIGVKPLILDIMADAAERGATSGEVTERVRERVPTVAKDTVGSVLSRLKADGALVHDGERYFDKRFVSKPTLPFEGKLRVAS